MGRPEMKRYRLPCSRPGQIAARLRRLRPAYPPCEHPAQPRRLALRRSSRVLDDGDRHVVRGPARVGGLNEIRARLGRVFVRRRLAQLLVLEDVVQAIAADEQDVAARDRKRDAIDRGDELPPQAPREDRVLRSRFDDARRWGDQFAQQIASSRIDPFVF